MLTTKTVKDPYERQIANQTIQKIAANSETFAKSIMTKVEQSILSGNYDTPTCQSLIGVISNVPGDSNSALLFIDIILKIAKTGIPDLNIHLVRALLKMTIKVPLLLD